MHKKNRSHLKSRNKRKIIMHRKKEKHLLNLVKIERKANQLKSRISLCWKRSKEKRKINR